jgi:hypothetical protein
VFSFLDMAQYIETTYVPYWKLWFCDLQV